MSITALTVTLAAQFPTVAAAPDLDPAARRGCSGHVLKAVAIGLAYRADDDGANAWPGIRELARHASVTTDTVRVALAHLALNGWAVRTSNRCDGAHRDVWALDLDAVAQLSTTARLSRAHPDVLSRAPRTAQSRAHPRGSEPRIYVDTSIRPGTLHVPDISPDNCGHRWRTPAGDCPVCLVEATG